MAGPASLLFLTAQSFIRLISGDHVGIIPSRGPGSPCLLIPQHAKFVFNTYIQFFIRQLVSIEIAENSSTIWHRIPAFSPAAVSHMHAFLYFDNWITGYGTDQ